MSLSRSCIVSAILAVLVLATGCAGSAVITADDLAAASGRTESPGEGNTAITNDATAAAAETAEGDTSALPASDTSASDDDTSTGTNVADAENADDTADDTASDANAAAANPDIDESTWCADLAPRIQTAGKQVLTVRYQDPDQLSTAVEAMHSLYREALGSRPLGIADQIEQINNALDELEPILRPLGWDFSQIDRTLIDEPDRAYSDAIGAIDLYNAETCDLDLAFVMPDDNPIEIDSSNPTPHPPQSPAPTELEIDLFMAQAGDSGVTVDEAACFLEFRYTIQDGGDPLVAAELLPACGLTVERLTEVQLLFAVANSFPGNPRTEYERAAMVLTNEATGMTNAEAVCHVDTYLAVVEDGLDTLTALDRMLACGLTAERMEALGLPVGCPWRQNVCASNQ